MSNTNPTPWSFLDSFRGEYFTGEWPTLPELFRITASRFPDRAVFTVYEPDRVSLTYREALERITAVAGWLQQQGIRHGDRVAVSGKNSPEWAVAYLAILFAGGVVVPIDYQLSEKEMENLLLASGAKLFFVDEERYDHFSGTAGAGEAAVGGTGRGHRSPGVTVRSLSPAKEGYIYTLGERSGASGEPAEPAREEELAAVLYTSGTTGKPKGVMLTHRNFVSDCFLAQSNLNIDQNDVFYALLPIHHSYCMLAVFIEAISVGAEIVFGKKFAVSQILSDLKRTGVTMFLGMPLLFNKLLAGIMRGIRERGAVAYGLVRALMGVSGAVKTISGRNPGKRLFGSILEKASLSTIRICISGGGPLAPSVFRQYNQLGIDFVQGYGLTETSPILTLNPVEHYKVDSVGRVIPSVDMRILDPDERGAGEIAVKGPMVTQGYYNMPEETAAAFSPEGYFRTGDVGFLDEENYLYITGRAKNLIVTSGGKNVYPEEIENEFQLYPEIDQILVRGFSEESASHGEKIEALIHPDRDRFATGGAAGGPASAGEIEERMRAIVQEVNQNLRPYQQIARVTVVDEPMPMTTTRKIKRQSVEG
ncbi:AMP-dependent synthetase/ligase [Salinispira pacifica]